MKILLKARFQDYESNEILTVNNIMILGKLLITDQ